MTKIRIFLNSPRPIKSDNPDKIKRSDKAPVFLSLTYQNVRKRFYLKETIKIKDVDPKLKKEGKVRLKNQADGASYINPWLDSCESKANEIVRHLRIENKDYTLAEVADQFESWLRTSNKSGKSWTNAFDAWEKHMREVTKISEDSLDAKKPLRQLIEKANIGGEMFSEFYLDRFLNYLIDEKQMQGSTVKKRLTHLREFLKFCHKKKYPFSKDIIDWKPSRQITTLNPADKDSVFITHEEYVLIRDAKLPSKHLAKVRDLAVIFYNTGQHNVDIGRIEESKIQNGILSDYRSKTGNEYSVPMVPDLQAILDKYNGKIPKMSLDKTNQGLKELFTHLEITRLVKIPNTKGGKISADMIPLNEYITTKVIGRNSLATRLMESGIDSYLIQSVLGHSDIKTQNIYKGKTDKSMDKLRKVIGG